MWPVSREQIKNSRDLSYFLDKIKSFEQSHSHIILEVFKGISRTGSEMLGSLVVTPSNIKHLIMESKNKYIQGIDVIDSFLTDALLHNDRNLIINVYQGSYTTTMFTEDKSYNKRIEDLLQQFDMELEYTYHNGAIDKIKFPPSTYEETKKLANKVSTLLSDKLGISALPCNSKGQWEVHIYYGQTENEEVSSAYAEYNY